MATINGRYSDLKITCGNHVWNVHKTQILSVSPVLETRYDKLDAANLSGEYPDVIEAVVLFCYHHHYPYEAEAGGLGGEILARRHVAIYRFASKFEMDDLKDFAQDKFRLVARADWSAAYFPRLTKDIFSAKKGHSLGIGRALKEVFEFHRESIIPAGSESNALWEAICTIPLLAAAIARAEVPSEEDMVIRDVMCRGCDMQIEPNGPDVHTCRNGVKLRMRSVNMVTSDALWSTLFRE